VRRRQDPHRQPAAALDRRLERQIVERAIGDKTLFRDGIPVDDEFHSHFACVSNAGALDIPERLFLVTASPAFGTGLLIQKRSRPDVQLHATGSRKS
jgi:hypothetical protein